MDEPAAHTAIPITTRGALPGPRTTAACTSTPASRTTRSIWPIEGGTNRTSGLSVQGVGGGNREQIEKVFYRAFTQLMPANATFAVARAATIQAARDLYRRQQRRGARRHAGLDRRGGEVMRIHRGLRDWLVGTAAVAASRAPVTGAAARMPSSRSSSASSGGIAGGGSHRLGPLRVRAQPSRPEPSTCDYPTKAGVLFDAGAGVRFWKTPRRRRGGLVLHARRHCATSMRASRIRFSSISRGRSAATRRHRHDRDRRARPGAVPDPRRAPMCTLTLSGGPSFFERRTGAGRPK